MINILRVQLNAFVHEHLELRSENVRFSDIALNSPQRLRIAQHLHTVLDQFDPDGSRVFYMAVASRLLLKSGVKYFLTDISHLTFKAIIHPNKELIYISSD